MNPKIFPEKHTSSPRRDWYISVIFGVLVYTAAGRLSITNWTKELSYVETVAVLGAVLGLALGLARFNLRAKRWMVFEYSLFIIPWQMTRLVVGKMEATERLASAGGRLFYTVRQFFSGQAIEDPIFFITLMSILFWAIGIYCGHRLTSGGGLLGVIIPPTIPLLVVQYYDGFRADRIWMLAFYFFMALVLIGRVNLLLNQELWQGRRVFTGTEPGFDLGNSIIVVAVIIVLIAWLFPTPAAALPAVAHFWRQVNEPLQRTRERLDDILAALHGPTKVDAELYGNVLGLGTVASQDDSEIFSITPPSLAYPRYYWRVRIYDTYSEGQWRAASNFSVPFSPEQPNLLEESTFAQTGNFFIHWKSGRSSLFVTPSQPIWVSRSSQIQHGNTVDEPLDVLSWWPSPAVRAGDQYQAHALLINPTVTEMRQAGTAYPEWVQKRYLQVPATFSADFHNLAAEITNGLSTPYDKAEAVTNYLRANITYNTSIPSPPPGMSQLDWFLFVWKRGYCNYYATAEVLLLRSAGVPARMAVGYAQGELQKGEYLVHGRDAHAWPEVYFPDIGWVEFEPTTSQEPISRLLERIIPSANPDEESQRDLRMHNRFEEPEYPIPPVPPPSQTAARFRFPLFGWWIIISMVLAGCGYGIWQLNRKKPFARSIPQFIRRQYVRLGVPVPVWVEHWVRWSELTDVERSFHAINQSLGWLGQSQPPHITPAERATLLKLLVPELAEDVSTLTSQHEQTLFSPTPGDPVQAARAAWKIRYSTLRKILRGWFIGEKDEQ